jgi:hypothetical protein
MCSNPTHVQMVLLVLPVGACAFQGWCSGWLVVATFLCIHSIMVTQGEDLLDSTFMQMHAPLEDFERQGTRGMDSTHTRKALDIDPSTIGRRDAVDATSTMRIVVGRCNVKDRPADDESLVSGDSANSGLQQWTLTVRTGACVPTQPVKISLKNRPHVVPFTDS